MKLTKGEIILKCFHRVADDDQIDCAYRYIIGFIETSGFQPLSDRELSSLMNLLKKLKYGYNKVHKKRRSWDEIERYHGKFLEAEFDFELDAILRNVVIYDDRMVATTATITHDTKKTAKKKRRPKFYADKRRTSKWKVVKQLTDKDEIDSTALLEAAVVCAQREKNSKRVHGIKNLLGKKKIEAQQTARMATSDESFEFFLSNKFSQRQYKNIQKFANAHRAKICPSYESILRSKAECYPDNMTVSEIEAKVPLQDLFKHSAIRLMQSIDDAVSEYMAVKNTQHEMLTLHFGLGYDGASGYPHFNSYMSEQQATDENIFATTCTILQLTASNGDVVWRTPSAASNRLCRTVAILYAKETNELIKSTAANLRDQMSKLQPIMNYPLPCGLRSVSIFSEFHLTLLDGKCFAILNDCSMQSCPICKRKPKEFNNLKIWYDEDKNDKEALKFGIAPLHLWIRIFECLLNVGYKKITCNARGGNTEAVKQNKVVVKERFKRLMHLKVDCPNPAGGNSNTGNVARRAFADPCLFGQCLGFDHDEVEIIRMLRNALLCFSCQLAINPDKFKIYCFKIFELWLTCFQWFPMTPTLHKLIFHGHELIRACPMPLGLMTEEAAEAKHKMFRSDRASHSRMSSRTNNIRDIFQRSLEFSDPYFSLKIMSATKKKAKSVLPRAVIEMLDGETDVCIEMSDIDYLDEYQDEIDQYMNHEELERISLINNLSD
jgi:hypothetical protein